jgi:hypothetical protein
MLRLSKYPFSPNQHILENYIKKKLKEQGVESINTRDVMKHDLQLPDVFENHLPQEKNNPTSFCTLFQADIFSVGISPPAKLNSEYRNMSTIVESSHETLRAACNCVMTARQQLDNNITTTIPFCQPDSHLYLLKLLSPC